MVQQHPKGRNSENGRYDYAWEQKLHVIVYVPQMYNMLLMHIAMYCKSIDVVQMAGGGDAVRLQLPEEAGR